MKLAALLVGALAKASIAGLFEVDNIKVSHRRTGGQNLNEYEIEIDIADPDLLTTFDSDSWDIVRWNADENVPTCWAPADSADSGYLVRIHPGSWDSVRDFGLDIAKLHKNDTVDFATCFLQQDNGHGYHCWEEDLDWNCEVGWAQRPLRIGFESAPRQSATPDSVAALLKLDDVCADW